MQIVFLHMLNTGSLFHRWTGERDVIGNQVWPKQWRWIHWRRGRSWFGKEREDSFIPPPSPSQRLSLKPWSKARWPPSSMISSLFGCVMQLLPLEFNSADWVRVCVWWWERAFHALELQVVNNRQNPRQTAEEFRQQRTKQHNTHTHTHTHTQTILSNHTAPCATLALVTKATTCFCHHTGLKKWTSKS